MLKSQIWRVFCSCGVAKGSENTENRESIITLIVGRKFFENASTAYVLQSGFILFCEGQFIIWLIFLATRTAKIRYFFIKQQSRKCFDRTLPHTHRCFWCFEEEEKKKI